MLSEDVWEALNCLNIDGRISRIAMRRLLLVRLSKWYEFGRTTLVKIGICFTEEKFFIYFSNDPPFSLFLLFAESVFAPFQNISGSRRRFEYLIFFQRVSSDFISLQNNKLGRIYIFLSQKLSENNSKAYTI